MQNNYQNSFLLILALCIPVTISCIDLMALSVALDTIKYDFSINITTTQWLLSGYTIGTGSFLIVLGRMADIYGRRKLLLIGVCLFALSSFTASISNSIVLLIFSRFAQGIASSAMMTTIISIITHYFPPENRASTIAKWGFSLGMGMAIGPLIGGAIIYLFNWRGIFLINIPICLLSFYLIIKYIPESKDEITKLEIDWLETILLTIVMLSFVTLSSQGAAWGWTSQYSLALISICISSLLIFTFIECNKENPLIDLSLFLLKNFSAATCCGFLSYFCLYAWLVVFSLYLPSNYGLSPLQAGVMLSFFSISFALSSKFIAKLINILGNRNLMQLGFIFSTLAFLWMTTITPNTALPTLALMFFLFGTAITFINTSSMVVATGSVPKNKAGIASGTIFTIRWVGGSCGIVIITSFYKVGISYACIALLAVSLIGFISSLTIKK